MRKLVFALSTALCLMLSALPAAQARARSAPAAVTGSATAVTENSASVGGTVTPNGAQTRYWFEYGTSTSYGSQTPTRFAGGGNGTVAVAADLHRLTPGTVYHFRLDASNSAGTTQGADGTFTTTAAPAPVVVTGSATAVTERSASVGGTVTPNGQRTKFWFEYGTSTSYGSQTQARFAGQGLGTVTAAADLRGLTPGTVYHFRLDASNGAGTTDGSDATFTTAAAAVPVVVTGSATAVTERSASVGGTVTPNGQSTKYWFEYGTSTSYGSHTRMRYAGAGLASVTAAADLRGLTPGTVYHFRLDASNASGTVDGSDATFTTAAASAPVVVTGPAGAVNASSARLTGTVTPSGARTTYWFEYGTSTAYGSKTAVRFAGSGLTPLNVAAHLHGLTPGTAYHYRLDAANAAGTVDGSDATFTTGASTQREWFAGSVTSVGSDTLTVGVSWTGPHDGALNGQTLTVAVPSSTRINKAPHNTPIALGQIQTNDLVALTTTGQAPSGLTALRIHVYCDCHWIGGTVSGINASAGSFTVQVKSTGPYDKVLDDQNVTIQTSADTVYMQGSHRRRIGFSDLSVGEGVGVTFAANGFFKATGFSWQSATFTATRVHVWGRHQVPAVSSDADVAAQTSVPS